MSNEYIAAMSALRDSVQATVSWYRAKKGMQSGQAKMGIDDPLGHGTSIRVTVAWFSEADAKRIQKEAEKYEDVPPISEQREIAKKLRKESMEEQLRKHNLCLQLLGRILKGEKIPFEVIKEMVEK